MSYKNKHKTQNTTSHDKFRIETITPFEKFIKESETGKRLKKNANRIKPGTIRNYSIGVAGIAGGNGGTTVDNKGVSLYSMNIFVGSSFYEITLDYVYDAIVMSSIDDPTKDYAFGLNVSSSSWGYDETVDRYFNSSNNKLLREAVHFANRAKVTFCASRGNQGIDNIVIPATIDDDWVLNVGGTGTDGCYANGVNSNFPVSFGHNVDIGAPASSSLVITLAKGGGSATSFGGTSAACPHVAGVVCLMMSYLNSPSPNYQNLAPEDCEKIIELSHKANSCTNNDKIGGGLLDAGHAMELIEKPLNAVTHFGTMSCAFSRSYTKVANKVVVHLLENYSNEAGIKYSPGSYIVDEYEVDVTVTHILKAGDNIMAFWPRPSSSNVLENMVGSDLLPRERVIINSCSNTECSMTGFIYETFDATNNSMGWWPFNPATSVAGGMLEYTILTHNGNTGVSSKNKSATSISVYPNPSSGVNTISFQCKVNSTISINLYDIQGKLLTNVYSGKSNTLINKITNNISLLSKGIYIYEIIIDGVPEYVKFVKQ